MTVLTRAGEADWPDLADLRLAAEGMMQPTGLYTDGQLCNGRAALQARFLDGGMWIARRDGKAVGAIGLGGPAEGLWDDDPDGSLALYLSKVMAVPRSGVADRLVEFAGFRARMTGRGLLRLDCIARNAKLRARWERSGFRFLRTVDGPEYEAALFERPVGVG